MHHHVVFAMQIVMSLSVGVFCMVEAANGKKTEIFLPVLTGILGYWLPAPNSNREDLRNDIHGARQEARKDMEVTMAKVDEFFKVRADDRQKRKALKKELAAANAKVAGARGAGVYPAADDEDVERGR